MVTGLDVTKVPPAELLAFLKMSVGACCPWPCPASLMFAPCITCCCCWPDWLIWLVIGDSVIVPFCTGALEKVTRLLFIVTIVEVCVLLVGYTNLTGSFFGIFDGVRGWSDGCWPATKFEKICW